MAEQFLNKAGTQIIANKIKEERAVRQNLALQLNTLKGVAMTMYASESLLPSAIDFENGVVVAVGEIAWCVAEKTWHRVSAVNSETLAITWSDYDPHIQADIDLSKYSKNLIIDKAENITAAQKEEYDTFDTTDNECGMVFGEVAEGDHNAVDGDTVYSALSKVSTGTGTFNATNIDTSKSNFCKWREVGKVVQVSLQFYLLRKLTWNDTDKMLISGLPTPFNGGETFICFNLTSVGIGDMQLVNAGQLMAFDAVIGADAGSRIVSNFTYIAK